MSRTDKDRPYWVRCQDPGTEQRYFSHHHVHWRSGLRECDADKPINNRTDFREQYCSYGIPHTSEMTVPKWYADHVYHSVTRRDARDTLREAAKEWNATGDTDLEPVPWQARNCARYYFW